jgi:transposase InsO family protein
MQRIKDLERENKELRRANEILRTASAFFAQAELDRSMPCPLDRVHRQFKADRPNHLWVSDFTYVLTWQGWLYMAFIIDVFARRIVGWRVSTTMTTDFVLDALEQALYARQPADSDTRVHHSDRGLAR